MVPGDILDISEKVCDGVVTFDSTYVVTVHESELPRLVRLTQKADTVNRFTKWCYELQIQTNEGDAGVQVIEAETGSGASFMDTDDDYGIEYVDVNFDGYLDIKLFNFTTPAGRIFGYDIYLFDQEQKSFEYSAAFTHVFEGSLIEINEADKEIVSFSRRGCANECWVETAYRMEESLPVKYRRKSQWDTDQCESGFILKEEKLVDGELKVVKDECI